MSNGPIRVKDRAGCGKLLATRLSLDGEQLTCGMALQGSEAAQHAPSERSLIAGQARAAEQPVPRSLRSGGAPQGGLYLPVGASPDGDSQFFD